MDPSPSGGGAPLKREKRRKSSGGGYTEKSLQACVEAIGRDGGTVIAFDHALPTVPLGKHALHLVVEEEEGRDDHDGEQQFQLLETLRHVNTFLNSFCLRRIVAGAKQPKGTVTGVLHSSSMPTSCSCRSASAA